MILNIGLLILAITMSTTVYALTDVKMAVFMSGHIGDLGFNFMVNNARVNVEKSLQLTGTKMFQDIISYDETIMILDQLYSEGYNLVICSSFEHKKACYQRAKIYSTMKFLIKDYPCYNRDVDCSTIPDNVSTIQFNICVGHYIIGYIAGLMSKSRKTGMVIPGPPSLAYVTTNSFMIGVQQAVADHNLTAVQVYNVETGAWLAPDYEIGATTQLIQEGVDIVGMSADDLSVHQTAISFGATAFGTSGYPVFNALGESILTSVVKDWTSTFRNASVMVRYGNWSKYSFNGDLTSGDITLDTFSYLVDNVTATKVYDHWNSLLAVTNSSRHIYYCHPLYKQSGYKVDSFGCVSPSVAFVGPTLLNKVTQLGRYQIPPIQVKVRPPIVYGFSITAGITMLIGLVLFFGILILKDTKIMKSASPIFCMAIIFGGLMVFAGVIIWAQNPTTPLCRARYWLLSLGYTILLGNMVVKNFRIWLIFDNPKLKKLRITNITLLPYIGALIIVNAIILAVFTGIGNVRSEASFGIDGLGIYEYLNQCKQNQSGDITLFTLLAFHGITLLVGCFVSWKIRVVQLADFNESKPIANTLYAISFCLFIIIPLMVAKQSVEGQVIIICAAALFTTFSALIILFLPKFWRLYTKGLDADPFSTASSHSLSMKNISNLNSKDVQSVANVETVVVSSYPDQDS